MRFVDLPDIILCVRQDRCFSFFFFFSPKQSFIQWRDRLCIEENREDSLWFLFMFFLSRLISSKRPWNDSHFHVTATDWRWGAYIYILCVKLYKSFTNRLMVEILVRIEWWWEERSETKRDEKEKEEEKKICTNERPKWMKRKANARS